MDKKDIYLDRFSWGEYILFRVGDDFNFIRKANRDNSEVEIKLKDYNILDYEGDGIKSFITNYIALHMNDKNILLLDEPESLLKGILSVSKHINIIRITREENINHFNSLSKDQIEQIIANPMLSSSNVLNGLFCEKVYICEAESDEEFFQSLHDKINPYDSAFFTHGKNKQTLKDISNAYKELNIPNYRIYDFDILRDDDFNKALNTFIDEDVKNKYIDIRKELNEIFDKDSYQNGGIDKITDNDLKNKVLRMLVDLKTSKIIILKQGCLESCLFDRGISYTKNKNNWFKDAINLINDSDKELIESSYIYNWIFK